MLFGGWEISIFNRAGKLNSSISVESYGLSGAKKKKKRKKKNEREKERNEVTRLYNIVADRGSTGGNVRF